METLGKNTKILIVGLGLIGGSYAKALTDAGFTVGAIDTNKNSIKYALDNGLISSGRNEPEGAYIGEFDLVVFALYPKIFTAWIAAHQGALKRGALLTDVTGVKCSVVYEIQHMLRDDLEFIGAHPMAGREVSGVENACAEIFRGANYIVTPTEKNTKGAIEICKSLGRVLGFGNISELSPERHDEMIGFLSQLTHCIAVSLMVSKDTDELAKYTGDSFRDLTRIAKINDEMWSELFLLNRERLLFEMDRFAARFFELRACIENGDREGMREMMRLSTRRRENCEKEGSARKNRINKIV